MRKNKDLRDAMKLVLMKSYRDNEALKILLELNENSREEEKVS